MAITDEGNLHDYKSSKSEETTLTEEKDVQACAKAVPECARSNVPAAEHWSVCLLAHKKVSVF